MIGAIVGLVVGLTVNASTAWFAVLELGVPCLAVGGIAGLVAGLLVTAVVAVGRLVKR
jgi:hypothetical protein